MALIANMIVNMTVCLRTGHCWRRKSNCSWDSQLYLKISYKTYCVRLEGCWKILKFSELCSTNETVTWLESIKSCLNQFSFAILYGLNCMTKKTEHIKCDFYSYCQTMRVPFALFHLVMALEQIDDYLSYTNKCNSLPFPSYSWDVNEEWKGLPWDGNIVHLSTQCGIQ